jgi:hypothetical protein
MLFRIKQIVLPYSFSFIITSSALSGQPLLATVPFTSGHLSSLSKTRLRQYQAKDNQHFLLVLQQWDICHLYRYSIFIHQDNLSMQLNQISGQNIIHVSNTITVRCQDNRLMQLTNTSGISTILDSVSISIRTTVEFF